MNKIIGVNIKWLRINSGLSQEELAEHINVTKSTISQWERSLFYPKHKHINTLSSYFNVSTKQLIHEVVEHLSEGEQGTLKSDCDCFDDLKKIPYLSSIHAAAGDGCLNETSEYEFELIHLKELPLRRSYEDLFCINVSGDSMEPVLKNGSLVVIDTDNKDIVDGGMYVFVQEDVLRVKLFSHEKQKLKIESYNRRYKDEYYDSEEFCSLYIVGKVVFYATKLE